MSADDVGDADDREADREERLAEGRSGARGQDVSIVREQGNEMALHTFTYSETAKDRMEEVADAGGYQYGDKVKILYIQGER